VSIEYEKSVLRDEANRIAEGFSKEYIEKSNAQILRKFLELPEYKIAGRIFAYCSMGREVSTLGIIEHALSEGKKIALPVCYREGRMVFREMAEDSKLVRGKFGIPEPDSYCRLVEPEWDDVIIVPCLCCGLGGERLGHGMGYYDRYLSNHSGFSVCLCRKSLIFSYVPTDELDYEVDMILTE